MLSVIIQEHREGRAFVRRMLEQASALRMEKEIIYVTSMDYNEFYKQYGPFDNYKMPVSVIGGIQSCGQARNVGGRMAVGEDLLFMDSHVCFREDNVNRLLLTLNTHPDSIVAPGIQAIEFPSCEISGGMGYGVAFRFTEDNPFEWVWLPNDITDHEFKVPFVCGCAFSMKKGLFNILSSYGGFLGQHTGLSWEEEKSMRLWRLGYPTYSEPRAVFGHLYKGYANHPRWDEHSTQGYYLSRVIGLYVNVFNPELWNYLDGLLTRKWGQEYFNALNYARKNYYWLRNMMQGHAEFIDERWFLRTQ